MCSGYRCRSWFWQSICLSLGWAIVRSAARLRLKALAISGLSVCLATVHYPDVTPDKLLTAVFGGFFIGAGMGLAMRGGAVLDGTDIAALLISKKSHLFRVGDVILFLNILIFLTAEFFLGVEPALYSILTYLSATKTLDFLLHGLEEYTAITIVSERSAAIREALTVGLGRGVTVYKGRGGMSGADQEILLCVVTRLEFGKVLNMPRIWTIRRSSPSIPWPRSKGAFSRRPRTIKTI